MIKDPKAIQNTTSIWYQLKLDNLDHWGHQPFELLFGKKYFQVILQGFVSGKLKILW